MSDKSDISANLELNIADYSRNIQRATRQADDVDAALDAVVNSANATEKALNSLSGDIKVGVEADFSSVARAESALSGLDTTITPLVDISVANESTVRGLLDEFNGTLTTKLNVEDSELKDAQQLIDRLDGETIDTKVNAETGALDEVESKLANLQTLAIIDISMNLVGMIPTPADVPLLGAIIEADKAARSLVAKLGEAGSSNTALYTAGAQDVFTSAFGESQQDAADKYAEVVRLTKNDTGDLTRTNEDFAQVTKDAFTVAELSGEDFNKVIRAADTLVQTGLAPNFETAMDQITTGFQEGLNKGEDFLDTIIEYSGQFEELGFTAEEVFSTLKAGMDTGAFNTDFIADLIKEMNIRAQAAMEGSGAEFDALKSLGLLDEAKAFQAGEITGAEYMSGIISKLKADTEAGTVNPADFFAVLGTKAEDLTLPVVLELDPKQIQEALANVEGATLEAGLVLYGDLGSSWTSLQRTIETDLAASVSAAFDIPGKIQQFSDGVSKFSEEIRHGATIPQAIEVAFEIPGFADTVAQLQSTLGNLSLTIMEVAASILDAMGRGDVAGTVRGTVADQAERQLTFDLKLADDGAGISNAARAAIQRGVSEADVQSSLVTAGQEFIEAGDLEGARAYRDVLADMATIEMSPEMVTFLTGEGIDPTNLNAVAETLDKLNSLPVIGGNNPFIQESRGLVGEIDFAETANQALAPLDTALTTAEEALTAHYENMRMSAESKLPGIAEIATSSLAPVNTQVVDLSQAFDAVDIAFTTLSTNTGTNAANMSTTLSGASSNVDSFANNATLQFTETVPVAVGEAETKMAAFGVTVTNTMLQAGEDVQGLIDKLLSIATLDITMPGVGGSGGGGGQIPGEATGGVIPAGETHRVHGGEMLIGGGGEDVAVLNRQTSSIIDSAVAQVMASSGMGGGGGNVTNNISNTWIINAGGASAGTAAIDQSRAIRGF